ncbi:MAG TPA: TetR/AcrR family transcriptional regulator [Candidatus Acidoferrum sp.]|nr:TetR/AcrR family transcriptional regulator [Candidatus Acidoferrum sp.]
MDAHKIPSMRERRALEPQRRSGRLRVAALLEAGAAVIAERGFEAATMAEVAARAGAPIGSLYRFFPNKEVLADALLQRYVELVEAAFANIDAWPETSSTEAFTNALLDFFADLCNETQAIVALLEARSDWSEKRAELRAAFVRHIAEKLRKRNPRLAPEAADDIAHVLLHTIKTMKALRAGQGAEVRPGAIAELNEMTRLYLISKLGDGPSSPEASGSR